MMAYSYVELRFLSHKTGCVWKPGFVKFGHIFCQWMRSTWPGQNVTQMSWMIHTQPTYDPVAQWN